MEVLAKALSYERISLDAFLKVLDHCMFAESQETRKLAREQFFIKALIQKILKSAGLETGDANGNPVIGAGMTSAEYYYS